MNERILLVEDDAQLGRQIVGYLDEAGFATTWVTDGDEAMATPVRPFQLVILDLMLPGAYGLDVLKAIRKESDLPVLVLSARNDTTDKVRALELGADDFVTKPFWPEELLARLNARLRRPVLQRTGNLDVAGLSIDTGARTVRADEELIELTRVEFDVLVTLARRPGAAVQRRSLVDAVLGGREGGERALDVHVSRLRKKLGPAGKAITTVWGVGYRLLPEIPS